MSAGSLDDDMLHYKPGDYVPSHFNGSIVAASYFASLCGCVLTIELLHRRGTGLGNLRSWLENFACAVAFGVMGIWCMHFIGNRAIVMDDGQDELQLVYAPGFTTLSVFLPIIGLTMAFAAAELPTKTAIHHWLALTGTGIFAGLSIVGMHYVGNQGIYNYNLIYSPAYFAASVLIAIGDCLGVLVLFYTWRDKWISAWWKRVPCAFFLAGGVSAMHFTASVGCSYQFKSLNQPGALQGTNAQVIIASVLCGAAALTVLGALVLTQYRVHLRRQKAKKVMLICAMFDDDGKILVTTEGVLPAHEITDKYNAANFSESLDTGHPVFHWIYRVTFNWPSVVELISRMKLHVSKFKGEEAEPSRPTSSASSAIYDPASYNDYSIIFREQFCVAASHLASALHLSLDKVGVLYDKIIETGTYFEDKRCSRSTFENEIELGQSTMIPFGRGQALVLVSQVGSSASDKLLNAGYKFAGFEQVGKTIADSLQVPAELVELHFRDMMRYIDNLHNLEKAGTWVGFFAPVPVPHTSGFDVAVNWFEQNQLPDVQLLESQPAHWQAAILSELDGRKSASVMRYLDAMQRDHNYTMNERQFASACINSFRRLAGKVPIQWWAEARFYAHAVGAPYSHIMSGTAAPTALYTFIVLGDVHTTIDNIDALTKIPLSFFSARQRISKFSRDHQILAREVHQEFGAILGRKLATEKSCQSRFRKPNSHKREGVKTPTKSEIVVSEGSVSSTGDSLSNSGYLSHHYRQPDNMIVEQVPSSVEEWERENIYGGIMVDSETVVRTELTGDLLDAGHPVLGMGMGAVADASRDKQEDTFADELLRVTLHRCLPNKPGFGQGMI